MRVLVDENVSSSVVLALADAGHDVERVAEVIRSVDDAAVLTRAISTEAVLVTFDAGFWANDLR